MTAAGIEGAGSIDQLNYFQNAFDSTVQGVDVVASYRANLIEVNPTTITAAFNLNTYKIDRVNISSVSFNEVSIYNFKHNARSEEHTSELQSLMRISYAYFCLKNT